MTPVTPMRLRAPALRTERVPVLDIVFVVGILALIALVALIAKGVEKL